MRRWFFKPLLSVAAASLVSCAGALQPYAPAMVDCRVGLDCDRKWSRAARWVAMNAFYPIETRTDSLIKTSGPWGKSAGVAASVMKTPAPGGSARIVAYFECASIAGCAPTPEHLSRTFVAYVSGASSLVVDIPRPDLHARAPAPLGDPLLIFQ
jgi:hypothetical protein